MLSEGMLFVPLRDYNEFQPQLENVTAKTFL